tara:strand:- start:23749 stop:30069 length:6321 start_codon:yes stop_codon:yes gene_type:complete
VNQPKKHVSAVFLVLLLVLVGPSTYVQSRTVTYGPVSFQPATNETTIDANITSIQVPANHTITSGFMSIEPIWETVEENGTYFGADLSNAWANGTHNLTSSLAHGGQLSLATDSSVGTLTDFESTKMVPTGWLTMGHDGEVWGVENLSSLQTGPNPRDGNHSLAYLTTTVNASGCIISPHYQTPEFISNMSLTFDHWRSLASDDAAWVEYTLDNQSSWQQLIPNGGYSDSVTSNHHTMTQSLSSIWAGDDEQWTTTRFELDYLSNIGSSESMRFRLCIAVGSSNNQRDGWFIDNMTWHNQGDEPGSWFHGNLSGDYAPNADGNLVMPINFAGLANPIELEIRSNWDIEGGTNDGMTIWYSMDQGVSWVLLSPLPGLPGNGVVHQGVIYNQESFGWLPMFYPVPATASTHTNASNALLKFNVQTDSIVNHGGGAPANGWEGIMIDDVTLHSGANTANHVRRVLSNFTNQPTYLNGSTEGWLDNVSAPNQWQWVSTMGVNGPVTDVDSFENAHMMPEGWSIENFRGVGWSHGVLGNTALGPSQWHSGQYGVGIELNGQYAANSYAHLISPEYVLPDNVTAQLSFRQWICTEAAWDGGAVSVSTDGGLNWWYLPADPGGFHDRISTVNTNSPFYGEGLLDGSQVTGGCGSGAPRPFELKTSDISNLSGQSVRLRFSFFSDQYVERDGWYVDDAGIDVSLFELEGDWVSPSITPHPLFGYGHLDGLAHEPDNTTLRFSLLDANGAIIPEYEQRIMPFSVDLNPVEYPSVQIVAHMTSNNSYLTPTIDRLGLGVVQSFGLYHQKYNTEMSDFDVTQEGFLQATTSTTVEFIHSPGCVYDAVTLYQFGGNLSLYSFSFTQSSSQYFQGAPSVKVDQYNVNNEKELYAPWSFTLNSGEVFSALILEPRCLIPPKGPHVTIGQNQLVAIDWPPTGNDSNFGVQAMFDSIVNGTNIIDATQDGQLYVNTSSSTNYQFRHLIALPMTAWGIPNVCPLFEGSFTLQARSGPQQTDVYLGASILSTIPANSTSYIAVENTCPYFDPISTDVSNEWIWGYAIYTISTSNPTELAAYDVLALPKQEKLKFGLNESLLNQALNASYTGDDRTLLDLPFRIQTERGSVRVDLEVESQPDLVDSVIDAPGSRWLPNTLRSITTYHERVIPTHPTMDAPALERITLSIGSSDDVASIRISVEADRLDSTPRFIQTAGAGYATLQPTSNVTCVQSTCTVTWVFKSSWLNDDIDDLHWFISSIDENGLETGPLVYSDNTPYNDIENDLEAFNVIAYDHRGRALHDWTQPLWPLHVNPGASLTVQGQVRYQGIVDAWVGENDAEVTVEVSAIPPLNESGPDQWEGEPIVWLFSNVTTVDSEGRFSIPLTIPDAEGVPSDTRLEARIILTRCGPSGLSLETALDQTEESTFFEMMYDKNPPDVIGVEILDPSGLQPADNHVWLPDRDVPLRLYVEDAEGLETPLTIYTWSEDQDDTNGNGIMEESEYKSMTANVNRGALQAEVDLPLLDVDAILSPGESQGRLSVVITGYDLAGNPLQSGGSFGEENDAATILVQPRQATLLDMNTVTLDSIDGYLFPGQEHHFQFDLIDGNGIDSLDSINIGLMNSLHEDCWIEYSPRFQQTAADVTCFVAPPTITATKDALTMRWTLDVAFQLRWDAMHEWSDGAFTPSIKVIDEAQDVGLSGTYLTSVNWSTHTRVELRIDSIYDRVAPFGILDDGILSLHIDDFADVDVIIVHQQTEHRALNIPFDSRMHYNISSFGVKHHVSEKTVDSQGLSRHRLVVNQTTLPQGEGELTIELTGSVFDVDDSLVIELTLDSQAPTVSLEPGTFTNLDSLQINEIPVQVSIQDDIGVPTEGVQLHWCFVRGGIVVPDSITSIAMNYDGTSGNIASFSTTLDIESQGVEFEKSDRLSVWFSHSDRAGNTLSGQGTELMPLDVYIVWMAYEPTPISIEATPYRPVLGEIISIEFTLENIGYLSGSTEVTLLDEDGLVLGNATFVLDQDEKESVVWTVEAWDTGRLGMVIQLDDEPLLIPVPIADVIAEDGDAKSSNSELGLNMLLVLLAAGAVIASILMRKQRIKSLYDEYEYFEDEDLPPPRPAGFDDVDQEE